MSSTNRWQPAPEWASAAGGPRTSAVGHVLSDLREAITSQTIPIGSRLPSEAALAERYGVSRTVIREVLRACESSGLTVTRPGRGTFVVAHRPQDLVFDDYSALELLEARPTVEISAAGLAALRRTEDQLAELDRLIAAMAGSTDPGAWTELDAQFHLAIAQASGNRVFAAVLGSIGTALRKQSAMLNIRPTRREASHAEHVAIAAAITRQSDTEARDAMQFHLDQVTDAVADVLTELR